MTIACEHCGRFVHRRRSDSRFCSTRCRVAAHRASAKAVTGNGSARAGTCAPTSRRIDAIARAYPRPRSRARHYDAAIGLIAASMRGLCRLGGCATCEAPDVLRFVSHQVLLHEGDPS